MKYCHLFFFVIHQKDSFFMFHLKTRDNDTYILYERFEEKIGKTKECVMRYLLLCGAASKVVQFCFLFFQLYIYLFLLFDSFFQTFLRYNDSNKCTLLLLPLISFSLVKILFSLKILVHCNNTLKCNMKEK